MNTDSFIKEIEQYSLDDLKLIFETQKDLYSPEELALIQQRIQIIEKEEAEERNKWLEQHIPKEIICPKCDGPNAFENHQCAFCGQVLDKTKYFNLNYYLSEEDHEENEEAFSSDRRQSFTFQYIVSFLIPLVGFILGAILLGKDCDEEKNVGKTCIILGIVSILLSLIISFTLI